MQTIKTAIKQFDIRRGNDESNLSMVKRRIYSPAKQGMELILLPEMWSSGFANERLRELSYNTRGSWRFIRSSKKAAFNNYWGFAWKEGRQGFYTAYVADRDGSIAGVYWKLYLFSPTAEDRYFKPGRKAVVRYGRYLEIVSFKVAI